jgi:iron complex transport system permease protein
LTISVTNIRSKTATKTPASNTHISRFGLFSSFFVLLLIVLTAVSILLGSATLPISDVLNALFLQNPDTIEHNVIWNLRLPRTILAIIVGIHFALSGLILQSVIRNPLADSSVIGVSGGASLAIVIFLLLADAISGALSVGEVTQVSLSWLPFVALIGGLLVAFFILSITWETGISPAKLALNGVAIGAILNALVMWTIVTWGGSRTETSIIWLAGSLYGRDFEHISLILPWSIVGVIATFLLLRPLSIMRFDSNLTRSLGLNVSFWRITAICIAVALSASAISVAGPVGFVGLIIPHLARLCVGSQTLHLAVVSGLAGGCLTLGADIVSRLILSPLELPVGAITTMLGIPLLLFMLHRQGRTT